MIKEKVRAFVAAEVASLLNRDVSSISDDMTLVGSAADIKSRELVELMLACEDFLETEYSAEFNWHSDAAMSGARSRLRTVGTLVDLVAEKAGGDVV